MLPSHVSDSNKTEKWKERLADLKRRARKKNPTVHAFKQLKECVRSTKNKLKVGMGEIEKMQEFVTVDPRSSKASFSLAAGGVIMSL